MCFIIVMFFWLFALLWIDEPSSVAIVKRHWHSANNPLLSCCSFKIWARKYNASRPAALGRLAWPLKDLIFSAVIYLQQLLRHWDRFFGVLISSTSAGNNPEYHIFLLFFFDNSSNWSTRRASFTGSLCLKLILPTANFFSATHRWCSILAVSF